MHLAAIRLRGFKSFPDPVEIRLEPGVAVVVGPNGSGKSNVADAIVWAAGSLSPTELRAEKPDDVLFAGSGARGPAEHCEVELLFDNQAGDGPIEWSELAIARRLHRGGEGQYLVNGTAVRRTDVVELLADLGLGAGMHSLIGQGRVEEILGASPERRRELVEEAAGLGRFKRRRHRAELKLARVATQVERARDVEDEVRRRLRPLALQATAAERSARLAAAIAGLRARLAELDLEACAARLADADGEATAAALARRLAEDRLETLLSERARAEEELGDAAGARERATAALYRLGSARDRLTVRIEPLERLLAAAREELDETRRAGAAPSGDDTALEREAAAADAAAREAERALERAHGAARDAWARLASLGRREADAALAHAAGLGGRRDAAERDAAEASARRDRAASALYRLRAVRDRVTLRADSVGELRAAAAAALADARAEERSAGPSPDELERAADAATAAARAAAVERDALAERARSARERLAALERALAEREGLSPAARALAEAGERLAVAALDVPPGTERAVAAALATRAGAVVADDVAAGLALLERARRDGLGSLSVVVGPPRPPRADAPVAGATPLAGLVGRGAERLLDGVWLVDAERLPRATHGVVVTSEGHAYDVDRGELRFAGEAAEAVLLELEARRGALLEERSALERDAERAAGAADEAEARARDAEAAYAAVAPLRRRRPADPAVLGRVDALAARLDDALAAAAARGETLERALADAHRAAETHAAGGAEELRVLRDEEAAARAEAGAAEERAVAAERALARLGGAAEPVEDDGRGADALAADARELERELERASAAAEEARARRARADAALAESGRLRARFVDAALLERVAEAAARAVSTLTGAAAAGTRFEPPLRARVDAGAVRVAQLGDELRRLGGEEVDVRRTVGEAAQRAAAVDVERARIEADAAEARRRLDAAGAPPAEGDDAAELEAELERLTRRLESIGPVNPLAKEEYDQERERLDELAAQRADLERSLAELSALRAELADEIERRFADTFAAVAAGFEDVAAALFPGGEGRLALTELPEPAGGTSRFPQTPSTGPLARTDGSAVGVEIHLRPAGKRVTRLSLLSGGEKALGAIAFLFALFLARPCPFYLLDEVEAALDDANIGRFVELLRRYADRAQFIVITHQKRTMEAADVLYGVTMGPDGVSQVVSRRTPREQPVAVPA